MNERDEIIFPEKTFPYRVYYADTDAGGVMYYAQYLRMAEQMRALYIEEFGLSLKELADQGILFACRRAETDYISPAFLEDILYVKTTITQLKTASINFEYLVICPGRRKKKEDPMVIANCMTTMVCCELKNGAVKPKRIPKWIVERLTNSLKR